MKRKPELIPKFYFSSVTDPKQFFPSPVLNLRSMFNFTNLISKIAVFGAQPKQRGTINFDSIIYFARKQSESVIENMIVNILIETIVTYLISNSIFPFNCYFTIKIIFTYSDFMTFIHIYLYRFFFVIIYQSF